MEFIKRFLKDEEGVTAIEYALIAAGIAVGILIAVWAVRDAVKDAFNCVASSALG